MSEQLQENKVSFSTVSVLITKMIFSNTSDKGHRRFATRRINSCLWEINSEITDLNTLTPGGHLALISYQDVTTESNIRLMRILEMTANLKSF